MDGSGHDHRVDDHQDVPDVTDPVDDEELPVPILLRGRASQGKIGKSQVGQVGKGQVEKVWSRVGQGKVGDQRWKDLDIKGSNKWIV